MNFGNTRIDQSSFGRNAMEDFLKSQERNNGKLSTVGPPQAAKLPSALPNRASVGRLSKRSSGRQEGQRDSEYVKSMSKVISSLPVDTKHIISVLKETGVQFPMVCAMYAEDAQPGDLAPDFWMASLTGVAQMVLDNTMV